MKPLNHLVFDFGKHELLVEAHSSVEPSESGGLHDLHLLWAELLRQRELLRRTNSHPKPKPQNPTPPTPAVLQLISGNVRLKQKAVKFLDSLFFKCSPKTGPFVHSSSRHLDPWFVLDGTSLEGPRP